MGMINIKKIIKPWKSVLITVPTLFFIITVLRLLGLLQPLSFLAYDLLFITRPQKPPDERIIIVSIQESDIQKYQQYPISDLLLAKLIKIIKAQNATVIGLDIYRDIPVPPGHNELIEVFKTTPNLIGIKKATNDSFFGSVPAPPVLEELGQIAASDVIMDRDGVVRRGILFPRQNNDLRLQTIGLAVALEYLIREKEIYPKPSPDGWLQVKDTVFYPLKKNSGEYIDNTTVSYQIMLDFLGPANIFRKITLADVLEGRISSNLFTNKIVLIGMEAISVKDHFYTPYSTGTGATPDYIYGVEFHANVASQILRAVLDEKPLIKSWSETYENLWIFLWILLPSLWIWKWRKNENVIQLLGIIITGSLFLSVILITIIYFSFILQNLWIPSSIPLLGLWLSTITTSLVIYLEQILEAKNTLEIKVEERTKELKAAQEQIIAQERLAYLGFLSAGIIHEINNPVNLISNFVELSLDLEQELQEELNNNLEILNQEQFINCLEIFTLMSENIKSIRNQIERINIIVNNIFPEGNKVNRPPTLININELLINANLLVYYSRQIEDIPTTLKLETNFDDSIEKIKIIAFDLTQVLVNLINNAYDSLCEKQKKIQDKNYIPLIRLSSRNSKKAIEITIFDNGIGIAPELKNTIFQPFFTTKAIGKGTGLGLSLARDVIMGKYSGSLNVESELENYAKFIITIPKMEKISKI